MANQVTTDFVVNVDSAFKSVDKYKAKLTDLEKPSALGTSVEKETDKVVAGFNKAGKAVEDFDKKVKDTNPKPTISRYYENEADKVKKSVEEIKRGAEQVEAVNARLAAKEEARVAENARRQLPAAPVDTFAPAGKYSNIGDGKLYGESRFNETVQGYRKVGDEADKTAEKVEKFNTKINRIRGFGAVFRELGLGINETEINVAITAYEKLTEYLAKNAAATKAAAVASTALSGAQAAATVATVGATTAAAAEGVAVAGATTAVAAEGAAVAATATTAVATTAAYTGLAAAIAASAAPLTLLAAGAAIVYHITSDIRNEAERRLREEEKIAVVYGQQVSKVKELNFEFAQQRANAARSDNFNNNLKNQSLEQLISRDKTLELLIKQKNDEITAFGNSEAGKISANDAAEYQRELLANEQRIREIPREKLKAQDDAYAKRGEEFTKSNEQARQYEDGKVRERNELAKKRADDIDTAIKKVDELGKKYADTFDNLFVATSKNNPFAQVFSEGDRALDKLRENLKGLKPELLSIAENLQKTANADREFGTRLDNDLSSLDLKQKAADLRSFKPAAIEDTAKFLTDFTAAAIKSAVAANGGSNVRYNRLATGGFSQSNIADELTNEFDRVSKADGSFGGYSRRARSFADLTDKDKLDFLGKDNIGFQNKLSASFDLAENRKALNPEQQGEIDRKIISLASGVDPSKLTDHQREIVASSLEKEAQRKENAEENAQREREKQTKLQTKIAENQEKLLKIAEKDGTKGLDKLLIEIKDAPTAKATVTRANPGDTAKQMDLSGTYFEQSQK